MNYVWKRAALQSHLLWRRPNKYICAALKSDFSRREPSYPLAGREPRLCDAMEAVSFIKSSKDSVRSLRRNRFYAVSVTTVKEYLDCLIPRTCQFSWNLDVKLGRESRKTIRHGGFVASYPKLFKLAPHILEIKLNLPITHNVFFPPKTAVLRWAHPPFIWPGLGYSYATSYVSCIYNEAIMIRAIDLILYLMEAPFAHDDSVMHVFFLFLDDRVFIQGTSATPVPLIKAMVEHGKTAKLQNVELIHILTQGDADYTAPDLQGVFRANCLFIGANTRDAVNKGRADYMPIFLSEIPHLFRRNILDIDVALIQTSPPDQHGFCSLGASVDVTRSALLVAKHVIALCNPSMPRTSGDSLIHKSHIDDIVEIDYPLHQVNMQQPSSTEKAIGKFIAENLVENGATLQMGIGSIPNSVLSYLDQHVDLGIHSEMFSDGVVNLFEKGCITNSKKNILPGKIVASFALGSANLFKFIDNNPSVEMLDISFVNKVETISKNPRVTAINSCLEVDITGQVVSDSIGKKLYSGVGGQIDFIRGAALGYDGLGKPILTTPSLTSDGKSTIVPYIQEGAGVVTTRAHTHYVVTEYGRAFLFGKNLRQRAHALIHIAHPSYRESLEKAAFERLKCMPSP